MKELIISILVLIGGYAVYGALVERLFGVDPARKTPAMTRCDGVDYVPMPTWKVFMVQFLNIAGMGPIFGAIMGIMFGPAAFLWIVLGTIFAGGVHDFVSAMVCVRSGGASIPEVVGDQLGQGVRQTMRVFSVLLLLLVGAVFVLTPAGILANMTPQALDVRFWILIIFGYYILATLLPVDKVIGNLYPVFGGALLFMAAAVLVVLFAGAAVSPGFEEGLQTRYADAGAHPVFPMLFVSIACGAISGFHATQSPVMARCLKNERMGRPVFYGAMVAEGLVALAWAAGTIAFTGGYDGLASYMAQPGHSAGTLVSDLSMDWLGTLGGILAILGVVAAPITSGDTALRSSRLIIADMFHLPQRRIWHRVLVSLPIFAACFALMMMDFGTLWRYFAWSNQTLAMIVLWACTVYLVRHRPGTAYVVTLLPAVFMTAVSVSYLLFARRPEGMGLPWGLAVSAGAAAGLALAAAFFGWKRRHARHATEAVKQA